MDLLKWLLSLIGLWVASVVLLLLLLGLVLAMIYGGILVSSLLS